jgi:hypothetical protein
MNSPTDAMKALNQNLREQLELIGVPAVAAQMDDMLAHATEHRWSPHQLTANACIALPSFCRFSFSR